MRLFRVELNERRQPVMLKGEIERSILQNANLHFEGYVGGVEGYLNDKYEDGYAILTNFRIIWISYKLANSTFDGMPCHLPLGAISETQLAKSFLQLKPTKIKLHVRLDAAGYPSSDALTVAKVVKLKIVPTTSTSNLSSSAKNTSTDNWYSALQAAVSRQSWKAAPQGLLQQMHTPPPSIQVNRDPSLQSGGPMTPPPALLQSFQSMSMSFTTTTSGALPSPLLGTRDSSSGAAPVNPKLLSQLRDLGYGESEAVEALLATRNAGVEQAVNWLLDHPGGSLASAGPLGEAQLTAANASISVENPLLQPYWPPNMGQGHQQQEQGGPQQQSAAAITTPTPASYNRSTSTVGVAGVLRREERRASETTKLIGEAFTDLDQLMLKAEAMVQLAESFRARGSRLKTAGTGGLAGEKNEEDEEESEMDETLASELADLGIASSVTRETCGRLYYVELARQLAVVMETPVKEAGGALPLSEAYRRFCRARFTDLVSPDDLLQAVKKLPEVGASLRLKEYPSGVKVLTTAKGGLSDDATWKKVVDLAVHGLKNSINSSHNYYSSTTADLNGGMNVGEDAEEEEEENNRKPAWVAVLGPGITRAELAVAFGVPLPIAGEYLTGAEAAGMLCRDDGPDGLRFYKNFFKTMNVPTMV